MARIAKLVGAALGALLYVWLAAVRALPAVKRRKAKRRSRRRDLS